MGKKIIYLNGRFLTQTLTGVQRTAHELVKALDELLENGTIDNETYSYRLIYSGTIVTPIKLKNIIIVKKGFLQGNLWEQFELPMYTFGYLLLSMCTISPLFKRKQMLIVHDASFFVNPQFFSFALKNWYKVAIPLLGKIARQLITVSEFSKSQLINYAGFKAEKVAVISNAADHLLHFGDPDGSFILEVEKAKPYILAVSSLSANKNFKVISAAIKETELLTHKVLIAGGKMSTLQQSTIETSMNYLGYVSNEELKYLYQHASLFIFPSFYEGFGIPPLEAMIAGCPVLASSTSSMPEVLGDACVYFNPEDSSDLASKLHHLLQYEDELLVLKEKGLQRAKLYSWTASALKLHALALKNL